MLHRANKTVKKINGKDRSMLISKQKKKIRKKRNIKAQNRTCGYGSVIL